MRSGYNFSYVMDAKHGFGIMTEVSSDSPQAPCFFEDGTMETVTKQTVDRDRAVNELLSYSESRQYYREEMLKKADEIIARGSGRFLPGDQGSLFAIVTYRGKEYKITVEKGVYSYRAVCSCHKANCPHLFAASTFLSARIGKLMHAYVSSDLPVDKSLFLEQDLVDSVYRLKEDRLDTNTIGEIRRIIRLVNDARSDEYVWRFHKFLLSIGPYEYDSRFLEDTYGYLLTALMDDAVYQKTVLESGHYADPTNYEERQHRSNRASFKRVLKSYKMNIKELGKGDFQEDTYKEFLLKYRIDLPRLLTYYAKGKPELDRDDLSYLREIAALPELDPDCLQAAAARLNPMYGDAEALEVFYLLAGRVPAEKTADFYSGLRNITIPLEEIRKIPVAEREKVINNIPLSRDNFRYIMEEILGDAEDRKKGAFILRTIQRMDGSRDMLLKKALADETARLSNNRLLQAYVEDCLKVKSLKRAEKGDPAQELSVYFSCDYEMVNNESSFFCDFEIRDPVSGKILLMVREQEGKLTSRLKKYAFPEYTPALIRSVCLQGREKAYRADCEKNEDAVAAFLFEKKNKQFASEYRRLCDSFDDGEKVLLADTQKAGVEWSVYREAGSNALAFRIGNTRKYVVKDASEFLQAFKSGQTAQYGKDLILTHEIENLEEKDAAAVRLLMTARYSKGRRSDKKNKRYITVSDSLLAGVLDILSGRTIQYNEVPCVLRLETRPVRLQISDRYVLSADIEQPGQELINLSGKGYLVTRQKDSSFVMDLVEGSGDEINLIDFVCRNPSVSIKPILRDFQKNVYARFFERIDVDPVLQPVFARSMLRFNTYFDLEKSAITARTVILRDGQEISADALSTRIDRVRLELLQNYLTSLGFVDGVLAEDARVLAFFKMDFGRMKSLTNVYLSERLQNKELKSVGKPVIRVTYKNNLVQVFLEKSEYSEAELEKIVAGLRKKKKYIMLSGDRIIDLDSEAARDLGEAIQDFGMNPKDLYKKKKISFITAIKAFSHQKSCRVDKYLRDMIEEIRSFKEADIKLPRLNGTLREYQEEGFKWMSVLSGYGMGGILADDMGLGKTIQVIALIAADSSKKPSLVVCPKSLVFNWISEFAKFDPAAGVTEIYGPESRRREIIEGIDYHKKWVYITSYDSLRNDIGKYTGEFNYGILDEAQYIKNVHAQKTRSVKELRVCHRFALTGTPIENSIVDLWSIFDYIMPGYFEELSRFRDSTPEQVARKAGPFILRRIKEDVLEDLPPKYERILSAEMTGGQRKVYESMRMEARKALESGGKAFDILPYLTRLRQVCVDPGMFLDGYKGGSGKMELLAELITEYLEQNHRILIFSQFVKALEAIESMLADKKIPTYFLSGSTPAKDRLEMMDSFNNGSGTDVFLISLKAGGTGLNLTGADTVIHLDPWWNIAAENQASDRTHRIGQTRNVEVIKLIAEGSIEQRVVELQDIKREVIQQVISDNDGSVTSAKLEDIAFVLS